MHVRSSSSLTWNMFRTFQVTWCMLKETGYFSDERFTNVWTRYHLVVPVRRMPVLTMGSNGSPCRHHLSASSSCLTNLVRKQIWIKLTYTHGSFAISNLLNFQLSPPYEWGFSIIFPSGSLGYCVFRGWLIPHSTQVAYHYLVHRQNTHWIQMRTPTDLWILRKIAALWSKQHDH